MGLSDEDQEIFAKNLDFEAMLLVGHTVERVYTF